MSFKLFYTDYSEDKHVRSDEANSATLTEIIECMKVRLNEEDNFVGLIDANNVMLQFMVEEDASLTIDLPIHERKGSFVKKTDLAGCIEIVRALDRHIVLEEFKGLEFKHWGK